MSDKSNPIYATSLGLLTDLYQLTMAYGYWKSGKAEQEAVFHWFFRNNPFQGGYVVTSGLSLLLEYIRDFRFTQDDIDYLATLTGDDGLALFDAEFLSYLSSLKLSVDVHAMREGTIAFPHQPIVRISGPIIQCQLLETALLNILNFQTLLTTKAARICKAAGEDAVLEFGLRRAQGIDGGLSASRAAYVGGCDATSNVLAGKLFGIPVKGTHAHSWIMSFDDELEAFQTYADAMPNNCVFLVDTFDTLEGVRKAVLIGKKLREEGHELLGIRLDSGDLAWLSIEARKILDEGGFPNAKIIASNDLDEHLIENLKHQDAKITVWGVGTRLATAFDQPALGGVYKLAALRDAGGEWIPKVKLSEQLIKTSTPGILQVRRFFRSGEAVADMVYNEVQGVSDRIVDPMDVTRQREIELGLEPQDLLVPYVEKGRLISPIESLETIRERVQQELKKFHRGIMRLSNPHRYPVGLEAELHDLKSQLVLEARRITADKKRTIE